VSLAEAPVPRPSDFETIVGLDESGGRYRIGKLEAHIQNARHLAISVFIWSGDRLLLQQRADTKYHSGGLWANSCCSHPRWDESPADCAARRMVEELGFSVPLTHVGVTEYAAPVGTLFENEVVHCFRGEAPETRKFTFNPEEVQAVEWRSLDQIAADMAVRPQRYTPWFRIYMARHNNSADAFTMRG
jgi:isopentenyl-diphosphate delta-isomerase